MTPEQIDQLKADLAFVVRLFPSGLFDGQFTYHVAINNMKVYKFPMWLNERESEELKRILEASNAD